MRQRTQPSPRRRNRDPLTLASLRVQVPSPPARRHMSSGGEETRRISKNCLQPAPQSANIIKQAACEPYPPADRAFRLRLPTLLGPRPGPGNLLYPPTAPDARTGLPTRPAGLDDPLGERSRMMTVVRGLALAAVLLVVGGPFLRGGGAKK